MYKILLVDDEIKMRTGIKECFPWSQLGFSISGEASDGVEALSLIEHLRPEVVLTDIVMPQSSGIDLAMKISERKLNTKVVLLSAYKEFDYAQRALSYGVYRYILKPVNYYELIEVFNTLYNMLEEGSAENDTYDINDESAYEKLIADVKSYVKRNIASATLQNTAQEVGLSVSYLSRLFKVRAGINFSDYLKSGKMLYAKDLLTDYRLMIYEVASSVGYDSAKNFSRAFKQYFGVTPHEYRENPRSCGAK